MFIVIFSFSFNVFLKKIIVIHINPIKLSSKDNIHKLKQNNLMIRKV